MKFIFATHNLGKLAEIRACFPKDEVYSLGDFKLSAPEETGRTYLENALLKARYAVRYTGLPALADDSGIEVDHLGKQPGVYSARYGGGEVQNRTRLLKELAGVPVNKRGAVLRTILIWLTAENDPSPLISEGFLRGVITDQSIGEYGFGYDAIFYLPDYQKTLAQLTPELKNKISHRAKAIQNLLDRLWRYEINS